MPNKTLAVIAAFLLTLIIANLFGERKTITGINEKKNNDAIKKERQKKMKVEIWSIGKLYRSDECSSCPQPVCFLKCHSY